VEAGGGVGRVLVLRDHDVGEAAVGARRAGLAYEDVDKAFIEKRHVAGTDEDVGRRREAPGTVGHRRRGLAARQGDRRVEAAQGAGAGAQVRGHAPAEVGVSLDVVGDDQDLGEGTVERRERPLDERRACDLEKRLVAPHAAALPSGQHRPGDERLRQTGITQTGPRALR
jgi:hypothetical protein